MPLFSFVEGCVYNVVPNRGVGAWIHWDKRIRLPFFGVYHFSLFRLFWRTFYVCVTTVLAMLFPFFNDILGLLGAIGFWPVCLSCPLSSRSCGSKCVGCMPLIKPVIGSIA